MNGKHSLLFILLLSGLFCFVYFERTKKRAQRGSFPLYSESRAFHGTSSHEMKWWLWKKSKTDLKLRRAMLPLPKQFKIPLHVPDLLPEHAIHAYAGWLSTLVCTCDSSSVQELLKKRKLCKSTTVTCIPRRANKQVAAGKWLVLIKLQT